MNKIKLNDGNYIPQIGFGVFRAKFGKETFNAVTWALEANYGHIDTAKIYLNERSVGKAIKKSSLNREDIFVTTKVWNTDVIKRKTRKAFFKSLRRLKLKYVDLYLIHWPVDGYIDAYLELVKLQKEGYIKSIGVSNFQIRHLEELKKHTDIVPAVNQIESNPQFNNQELISYCQAHNIAVEVWSPLGGSKHSLLNEPTLVKLSEKYHKTTAQIIIRWHIQRGVIVLVKSSHKERIYSNLDVFDFELSSEDMELINSLNTNQRVGGDPDKIGV